MLYDNCNMNLKALYGVGYSVVLKVLVNTLVSSLISLGFENCFTELFLWRSLQLGKCITDELMSLEKNCSDARYQGKLYQPMLLVWEL